MHRIRDLPLWDSLSTIQCWLLCRLFPWFFFQERWWASLIVLASWVLINSITTAQVWGKTIGKCRTYPLLVAAPHFCPSLHNLPAFVYSSESSGLFFFPESIIVRRGKIGLKGGYAPTTEGNSVIFCYLIPCSISIKLEQELRNQVSIFLSASSWMHIARTIEKTYRIQTEVGRLGMWLRERAEVSDFPKHCRMDILVLKVSISGLYPLFFPACV